MDQAEVGDEVAISIAADEGEQAYMYGRQFDHTDPLLSKITRTSLDALKAHFADVCKDPAIFKLLKRLKLVFKVGA